MEIDTDRFYRAVQSRDARFDGRFFTAVVTTGVYCRPVCPARTPMRRNVRFYASAAAAEEAGFRPCMRCRPETAPGTPAWSGTSATVSRALRLIEGGSLDDGDVDRLAERLGVGARHLRRLFDEHLGAPPIAVAQVRRVHFARRLIDETDLPMTEIAFAAGFASVRRFQHAVRATFGRSPRELRSMRAGAAAAAARAGLSLALRLPYRPPYDWISILRFLAARAIPGVEAVEGGVYSRSVAWGDSVGTIRVRRSMPGRHLVMETDLPASRDLIGIVERVRRLFDLAADPAPIAACLRQDPLLRPLVRARPGLRVPGAWDRFELAVRAVLGQQITVKGASTLAGRIVRRCGATLPAPADGRLTHRFPTPRELARADLRRLGITGARIRTIRLLALEAADGALFDDAEDAETTTRRLSAIPGIGAWTAAYITMRAFAEPDILPPGDAGIRRAVCGRNDRAHDREIAARSEAWRPWRSYATLHLWTDPKGREDAIHTL